MRRVKSIILFAAIALLPAIASSQIALPREDDLLFRTEFVRLIDLNWPQSKEVFGEDNMISTILFDAVKEGKIRAYEDVKMSKEQFAGDMLEKLAIDSNYVLAPEYLTEIELGEDLIFDRNRSEHYFIPRYLAVYISEKQHPYGFKEPWAVFRFEDVATVFREDERAWNTDRLSGRKKLNYADIFVLKSFYSETVKIGHAHDRYFDQLYSDKVSAFVASKEAEARLIEFLYKLYNPM